MAGGSTEKIISRYDRWSTFYDLADRLGPLSGTEERWRRRVVQKIRAQRGWVLDAACGTGTMVKLFGEESFPGRLVAVDASRKMVERAQRRAREGRGVSVVLADVTRLPFKDGTLRGVICTFSLTTIGDPRAAISEFGRALSPGSKLVVLDTEKPRGSPARLLYPFLVPISRTFCRTHIDRDVKGLLDGERNLAMEDEEHFLGGMVGIYVYGKAGRDPA